MTQCNFLNCQNVSRTSGLCPTHYSQKLQNRSPVEHSRGRSNPVCRVSHCNNKSEVGEGVTYCTAHAQKHFRGEDPEAYVAPDRTGKTCWVEGCESPQTSKSLCKNHARYARSGRLKVPDSLGVVVNGPCSVEGCTRPYITKKMCHAHYEQARRGSKVSPKIREWGGYSRGEIKCAKPTCKRVAATRNLCGLHYQMTMKYKLTPEEFLEVWKTPVCSNRGCGETKRLHMDHDHDSGKFRGLLCGACNTGLGFYKDDFKRLDGIIEYLSQHKPR